MRRIAWAVAVLFCGTALAQQATTAKKRRPLPYEYGQVVLGARSEKAGLPPVVFEHWLHRARYTCRVCHVDIGFAMKAGATEIKAADNMVGAYCGACHDGKSKLGATRIFGSCAKVKPGEQNATCIRCHSGGKTATPGLDFASVTSKLPRGRFGNGVDWEKAEEEGLISPVDYVEGVSIRRTSLTAQKDFALSPKLEGMPEIIFSHKKHTVWSGCEGCHPDLFLGVKRGATRYTMVDIFEGKYCGACHATVAFPLTDCQRCHAKPVQ